MVTTVEMALSLTSARKIVKGAFGDIDLLLAGITDCNKHTIDIHCPLFSESPTNISLLFLNFSHISNAFHLIKTRNQYTLTEIKFNHSNSK